MIVNERELVRRIREALDAETAGLERQTLERLGAMRREAVSLAERKTNRSWRLTGVPRWVSASGVATMAVLVISVSIWLAAPRHFEGRSLDEIEFLTSSKEQLAMCEDLEFYRWLASDHHER